MEKMSDTERAAEKWGEVAEAGFQTLPDVLLKKQSALSLSATDLVVLINVLSHWWYRDRLPFPSTSLIARHMGVHKRTVERSLKKLTGGHRPLLKRSYEQGDDGEFRAAWDPQPLVEELTNYALVDPQYLSRKAKKDL